MAALPPVQAQAANPAQDIVNTALEVARGGDFDFAIGIITNAQDEFPNNPLIERTLNLLIQRSLPQNAMAIQQQAIAILRQPQAAAAQPYPNYAAHPPVQQPPRIGMMPPMPLPNNRAAPQVAPVAHKPAPRVQPLPLPPPLPPDNVAQHDQLAAMRRIMEVHGQNGGNQPPAPQIQTAPSEESVQGVATTAPKRKRKAPAAAATKRKDEPNTPGLTPQIENHWRIALQLLDTTHKQESAEITSQIKEIRTQIAAKKGVSVRSVSTKKSQLRPTTGILSVTPPAKKTKSDNDAAEASEGSE